MSTFATTEELTARLSSAYADPADAAQLLVKASELIDYATQGFAQLIYDGTDYTSSDYDAIRVELSNATCDQVEFWLEVGEETDVVGLRGSMIAGRVQVQRLPPALGPRALRTLLRAGLYWQGSGVRAPYPSA